MSKATPFFSVIIPTRNRAELLSRCINSILNQKFKDFEVIIIIDGSNDHTLNLLQSIEDERITYFYQDANERSAARNKGVEMASGKYVCFIDDDDYISELYLWDFYQYHANNSNRKVILRTGFWKENSSKKWRTINYEPSKHQNPVKFATYNMCGLWTLCIPRTSLMPQPFPEKYPHWQDTHLILRLFLRFPMVQLENWNYYYQIHDAMGSKSATKDFDPISRADLNVDAIKDLFRNYEKELSQYLRSDTLNFLIAEKYIQYFNNTYRNRKMVVNPLLRKSINRGIFLRLWKHYIYSGYYMIKDRMNLGK